jgi:hypothetical protein
VFRGGEVEGLMGVGFPAYGKNAIRGAASDTWEPPRKAGISLQMLPMEIAMKMLAALIAGLLLSMTTFVAGLVIAITFLAAEESRHPLDGQDGTTLWSSAPVAVDKSAQPFERLPARVTPPAQAVAALSQAPADARSAIDATPAETRNGEEPGVDPIVTGAVDPEEEQASWRDRAHADWCLRRYRSYDAESDSYRPYGGGTRACQSPYSDMSATELVRDNAADGGDPESAAWQEQSPTDHDRAAIERIAFAQDADAPDDSDHIRSCLARYRSYRSEDNSYQPFDGGPRRQCE